MGVGLEGRLPMAALTGNYVDEIRINLLINHFACLPMQPGQLHCTNRPDG
jgi:hypothetical protein